MVSCKCQVLVIFQNTTFAQLGQVQEHSVASFGGKHPSLTFCWHFQNAPPSGQPLLCECERVYEYVCVCIWVCACVWRGEWEGVSTREHSLLKMMWLISSVHKKENFVDLRKKKTKNKLRAKHNFYPPSQNLVFRSISQAVPFSSLHQNHAVWFPTLWNIIDLLEMKVHCKLRHTTLSPIGWMAGAGKPQLLEC